MCNFVLLYRSSSQSQDEFETFSDNFEMTLKILTIKNAFLTTTIEDFNTNLKTRTVKISKIINKTEGKTIESITSQFG